MEEQFCLPPFARVKYFDQSVRLKYGKFKI